MAWLTLDQISKMGFQSVGDNVLISDKASFHNCGAISIGAHCRIDDFCVIVGGAGGIEIGRNVHIAVGCSLVGRGKIRLSDFSGLSSRVSIYSSSDDYTGAAMTNPTVPREFTNVQDGDVWVQRHVIIGAGTVILPNVVIEEGTAIGALSLVKRSCLPFGIYAGNPAKRVAERKRDLLELEKTYLAAIDGDRR
jgi:galactoside O-acetyltransferase